MTGDSSPGSQRLRFGPFELDLETQELRKGGTPVRLQPQPFKVLALLARRAGHLVTREELRRELWGDETFVDFEQGLNYCVRQLRTVLGDEADSPRFIETLPRRGYRFIAPVEGLAEPAVSTPLATTLGLRARLGWVAAVGVLVIGIALAASRFLWGPQAGSSGPPLRIAPFTSYPGSVRMPAFSPDGERIAFSWTGPPAQGNWDIYVKLMGNSPPLRLTSDAGEDTAPAWSPDGRQIAFLRLKEKSVGIYTVSALGGAERKLTDVNFGRYFNLQWTGDGKSIIFSEKTSLKEPFDSLRSTAIFLLSADLLEKRQLTFPRDPENDHRFAVSPDGATLAFLRHAYDGGVGIFTVPLAGGQPKHLHTEHAWAGHVVWSADGRSLLFTSTREGGNKLWRIPVAGGEPQPVPIAEESAYSPTVAQRGDRLAYVREYFDTDLMRMEISSGGRPAAAPAPIAASARIETAPAFSPDGKRLAFFSEQSGRRELWVSDADGSNPVQMTNFFAWDTVPPTWSPDGKYLAFVSGQGPDGNGAGLFVMDVDSKQVHRLPGYSGYAMPQWSRDGRWIFVTTGELAGRQVGKIPAEGGSAVPITRNGGMMPRESPDGRYLYYLKTTGGIWRIPAAGGEESPVLPDFVSSSWSNWCVVSEGIYYAKQQTQFNTTLEFYDFTTHRDRRIAAIPGEPLMYHGGLTVSPDGKWIVYSQVSRSASDIMLVENFR